MNRHAPSDHIILAPNPGASFMDTVRHANNPQKFALGVLLGCALGCIIAAMFCCWMPCFKNSHLRRRPRPRMAAPEVRRAVREMERDQGSVMTRIWWPALAMQGRVA